MGLNIDEVVTSYTESLSFTAEGGEDAIEFDIPCEWETSISEEADWLTLNKYSGNSGRNYINVTAEENKTIEAREAVITIYNDTYKVSKEVTVYQEANDPYITLSNNELEFVKNKSSKSIEVESNTSWEAKCNAEWISLSPTSGSKGKTTMSVSVKENPYEESRTATITIVDNNQTELAKINVKQSCSSAYINLSNNSIAVKFNIPYILNIESTVTWSAEYDADIVSVTPNSGIGKVDATITIISQTTESVDIRFYNDDFGISTVLHITPDYTNCIFYTTSDGNIVSPYNSNAFVATIISNEIINGVGVIVFDDSVTSIGEAAFGRCSSLTSVTIPDSVTTIGDYVFYGCSSLTSITIPDSVTSIGEAAFSDCTSLTSITIPDNLTTVGGYAFIGCGNLNAVYITDLVSWCNIDFINPLTDGSVSLGANPLYYAKNLYLNGELVTDLVIPDGVNEIKLIAFAGCYSITNVTIPNSVTTIGDVAFYGCSSLTSVTIGDSVTTIGDSAFRSCSSLESVTIGDSVTTIGGGAFYDCSSLTSVTIPDSVTTIGEWAFYNCSSLTSVYCKATTPPSLGDYVFIYLNTDSFYYYIRCTIYVPMESVNKYKSASGWSEYADDIVGYNF